MMRVARLLGLLVMVSCFAVSAQMPDLTISKMHVGASFTQGQPGAYTITVNNIGDASTGPSQTITVTDTLTAGLTFSSGTGTGWSCNAAGQVVTCTDASTPIAAG